MAAVNGAPEEPIAIEQSWDAWSSRVHSILVGVLSLLLAALFMEKIASDWALMRYPSSVAVPEDIVKLVVLFLAYWAFFVMYFVRPDLPLIAADRVKDSFSGKKGLKHVAETLGWIGGTLLLAWLVGKPLYQAALDAMEEFKSYVFIVIGAGLLAGTVYVLFCRHPKSELGVRAWINRAGLAVIAAVSVWLLNWKTVAPYVPDDAKPKFAYDLTKDLLVVAVAVVFVVAASYELGRHMSRLKLDGAKRASVHSVAVPFAILVSILVPTVTIYAVILFFDFQWVNAIELRPDEVSSLMSWSETQLKAVQYHIILRDVFIVIPLLALSMGWAGIRIYYAWRHGPGRTMLDTASEAE